jgi:hypothetical protein
MALMQDTRTGSGVGRKGSVSQPEVRLGVTLMFEQDREVPCLHVSQLNVVI